MPKIDLKKLNLEYDRIRENFVRNAEIERVVICPFFGQRSELKINPSVYFEIFLGRVFQVIVESDEDGSQNCRDYYFSDFRYDNSDKEMLVISICHFDIDAKNLWSLRNMWLRDLLSTSVIEEILDDTEFIL